MCNNLWCTWIHFAAAVTVCSLGRVVALADDSAALKQPVSVSHGSATATSVSSILDSHGYWSTAIETSDERSRAVATCCDWCVPRWSARIDGLMWWTKGNQVPALVTTSPNGTDRTEAGVLSQPGTSILHGAELLDDNYRMGGRVSLGYWLDDCHTNAFDVTWFSIGDGANTGNYFRQSTGSPILARPFFDAESGVQNSELVAFPSVVEGSIEVLTSSELHSISALLRHNSYRGCRGRLDVVAGYRFLRFREGLTIEENLTSTDPGGVVAVGTTFDLLDSFSTGNEFNGAELGVALQMDHGVWSWDLLAKLAMGNMHQVVDIGGFTRVTAPVGAPVVSEGGLLALPTNIGRVSHDKFAMIPELNLNMQYQLCERLDVSLGYSMVWITSAVRSGDQVDFAVNPSQLPGNGGVLNGAARPAPRFETTSMWVQGINLGLVYQF